MVQERCILFLGLFVNIDQKVIQPGQAGKVFGQTFDQSIKIKNLFHVFLPGHQKQVFPVIPVSQLFFFTQITVFLVNIPLQAESAIFFNCINVISI